MKYKVRREVLYLVLKIYGLIISILPYNITVKFGRWTGQLSYHLLGSVRRRVKENLNLAFGTDGTDRWISKTAMGVFENLGKNLAEVLSFPKIDKYNIDTLVKVSGLEKVDRALKQGRGVIILASHLGNWELLACYFSLKGWTANVVARRLYFDRYDRLLNYYRRSKGVRVFDRDTSAKKLLRLLKDNQILGVLPDQDIDRLKGIFINFFGRPAWTPVGPVNLALASGAPIIPCFLIRTEKGHNLIVEEPIEVISSGDKNTDLVYFTQRWSNIVESYIRKYPEQWVWMHPRWKTRPENTS